MKRASRVEVRSVAPDANPYMVLYSIFKTGLRGRHGEDQEPAPGGALSAGQHLHGASTISVRREWTTKLLGEDVKGRYADLKQASADRCPRLLGTFVKVPEVQYHHEVYNQFLWNLF